VECYGFLFSPDQYFVRIVGVDIDPIQIQEAKLEASKRGATNVTFELCDIAQIDALLRVHRPDFVIAKNTVQFLTEVEEFLETVKRSGASYVQVSSPLFELEMEGNPIASAAINEELKLLLEEGELCQEVDEYWSFKEKDNFAKYCHPMRNGKRIQFNEYTQVKSHIHLLDLKKIVEGITVVKQYKARCVHEGDGEGFEKIYDIFLRKMCGHCGYTVDDVYFEDVSIVIRNTLYIEVTIKESQKLR